MTATIAYLRSRPSREKRAMEERVRVVVRWPDNSETRALGYTSLLHQIRDLQWGPMSRRAFRAAMAHRAAVWTGTKISTRGSSRRFVRELARAGIFEIEQWP